MMCSVRAGERTLVLERPVLLPEASAAAGGRWLASPIIEVPGGFRRAAPSWNVRLDAGQGFVLEMRVGRAGLWSPYLMVGQQGSSLVCASGIGADAFGAVEVDEFVAAGEALDRAQLRITFCGIGAEPADRLARLALAFDSPLDSPLPPGESLPVMRLEVPFRSQFDGSGALGPRLCNPTCLAMVLAYSGLEGHALLEVAQACYDARHDVYGGWSRAVQAAFEYGLPGYVKRFAGWAEVARLLGRGRPIIASIRFGAGELPGSAVRQTKGHLVVVTGFAAGGEVWVNDPAFAEAAEGVRTYPGAALARAWFDGSGIGYVLGE